VLPIRDENPTSRLAIVTIVLIAINVVIYFAVQMPKQGEADVRFTYRWAAVPCELDTGKPVQAVPIEDALESEVEGCALVAAGISEPQPVFPEKNVWLSVLVSMFLHGSPLHLLGNMLFLWIFGNNVEDQLGGFFYLLFYVVGGIAASALHVFGDLESVTPFLGASGAIAAVMGAYMVWFPQHRVLTLIPFLFSAFSIPALYLLLVWFGMQFLTQESSGIATLAHIGGFVFGALIALLLRAVGNFPRPPRERLPSQWRREPHWRQGY
jgi:membrane associated rhomboid family serine protease